MSICYWSACDRLQDSEIVGTHLQGIGPFILAARKDDDVTAHGPGIHHGNMAQSTQADDANAVNRFSIGDL